jgi:hypothetical protein
LFHKLNIFYKDTTFKLSVGKNLALLQAEESASVLELVNVPNVRWHFLA